MVSSGGSHAPETPIPCPRNASRLASFPSHRSRVRRNLSNEVRPESAVAIAWNSLDRDASGNLDWTSSRREKFNRASADPKPVTRDGVHGHPARAARGVSSAVATATSRPAWLYRMGDYIRVDSDEPVVHGSLIVARDPGRGGKPSSGSSSSVTGAGSYAHSTSAAPSAPSTPATKLTSGPSADDKPALPLRPPPTSRRAPERRRRHPAPAQGLEAHPQSLESAEIRHRHEASEQLPDHWPRLTQKHQKKVSRKSSIRAGQAD